MIAARPRRGGIGSRTGIFWRSFQGWDPIRKAGLVYLSHPAGLIGLGYLEDRGREEPRPIQDFWSP